MPAGRPGLHVALRRDRLALDGIDVVARSVQLERRLLADDGKGHLERRALRRRPAAFRHDERTVAVVIGGDDMVDAALGDDARRANGRQALGLAEEVVHFVDVVYVQVQERTARAHAIHEPVLPGVAVHRRRNALERGGLHLAGLAALEVFPGMAIFRPGPHAQADIEERLGLLHGGDDFLELRPIATKRLFAKDVLSGGEGRADELGVVGRRHADVNDVHVRIGQHRKAAFIDRHARQIQRLGVVAATNVTDHLGDVPTPLGRVDIRDRRKDDVLHALVDAPMGRAHETHSNQTDLDLAFHFVPFFRANPNRPLRLLYHPAASVTSGKRAEDKSYPISNEIHQNSKAVGERSRTARTSSALAARSARVERERASKSLRASARRPPLCQA